MRRYSTFWLAWAAGLITLSPVFAERDTDPDTGAHPLEDMPMRAWLRLDEAERAGVVDSYAPHRRLRIRHAA